MDNAILTSLFALGGVLLGTLGTSINTHILKRKETKLRIIEKILDKRIAAHEELLGLIKSIRTVVGTGMKDKNDNAITYPVCMQSKDHLTTFIEASFPVIHKNSHWLDTELEREFSFFQDYVLTLSHQMSKVNDSIIYTEIGIIIKQDFINLASRLENLAFNFFRYEIASLRLNQHNEWHKYPKAETQRKFSHTEFIRQENKIQNIINSSL
jgi:hypothetical protein